MMPAFAPAFSETLVLCFPRRFEKRDERVLTIDEPASGLPRPPAASPVPQAPSAGRTGSRPDADLLTMAPNDALAGLTERYAEAVYRVALSVTRQHDLAEDVSQDALLKAWNALPSYRSEAPLRNWLLRITHNTAVSALRRQRDVMIDPNDLPEPRMPRTHSTEVKVEGTLAIDAFDLALDQLDSLSRSIVVLRELEGMAYDEIAETLDVPLPTVKTRLLRARRVLAVALEEWRP